MTTKEKTKDSWELDSGLPDDFPFYIERAFFGYREEYMDGRATLLIWEGSSPEEDVTSVIWPVGSGWKPVRNGEAVEHPKRQRFVRTSMIGRLIERVVGTLGVDMRSRGPATEARVWQGLGFHLKREEIEYGSGILEEKGGRTVHLMPVAVLPERQPVSTPRASAAPAPAGGVVDRLVKMAKAMSRDAFQRAALNLPEVSQDVELFNDVLDDSEAGFYTRVRGA